MPESLTKEESKLPVQATSRARSESSAEAVTGEQSSRISASEQASKRFLDEISSNRPSKLSQDNTKQSDNATGNSSLQQNDLHSLLPVITPYQSTKQQSKEQQRYNSSDTRSQSTGGNPDYSTSRIALPEGMHKNSNSANDGSSDSSASRIIRDGLQHMEVRNKKTDDNIDQLRKIVKEQKLEAARMNDSSSDSHMVKSPLEPTQEDRAKCFEKLEKQMSQLIPAQERQQLLSIEKAILNGDLSSLEKLVKGFGQDSERLEKFVDQIAKQFKAAQIPLKIEISDQGKVLLYRESGGRCLELSPAGERTRILPISTRADGTTVLESGTVIGKKAMDVLKEFGNGAVNESVLRGGGAGGGANMLKESSRTQSSEALSPFPKELFRLPLQPPTEGLSPYKSGSGQSKFEQRGNEPVPLDEKKIKKMER